MAIGTTGTADSNEIDTEVNETDTGVNEIDTGAKETDTMIDTIATMKGGSVMIIAATIIGRKRGTNRGMRVIGGRVGRAVGEGIMRGGLRLGVRVGIGVEGLAGMLVVGITEGGEVVMIIGTGEFFRLWNIGCLATSGVYLVAYF